MSDIAPGLRAGDVVDVAFRARAIFDEADGEVHVQEPMPRGWSNTVVHASNCTLIRRALQLGDTVTADTPEPPVGTVLVNEWGHVFTCLKAAGWGASWVVARPDSWAQFLALQERQIAAGSWTVLRVGGEG